MFHATVHELLHATQITVFVAVMMVVIEFLNILSSGRWIAALRDRYWLQLVVATFLGATPGCLGAFAVVAMYSHKVVSLGAVVAAMIATSGDESFVMLAMIPKDFVILTGLLSVIAILAGWLTDMVIGRRWKDTDKCDEGFAIHEAPECYICSWQQIRSQWRHPIPARGLLTAFMVVYLLALASGYIGHGWNWTSITMAGVILVALGIVVSVNDHFLESHLWEHVILKHVPRIFLFTAGSLILLLYVRHINLTPWIKANPEILLGTAGAIGIIPESGPHLIFVNMYAEKLIPFSILLTSSIVQDGHGMLPLMAQSWRDFLLVKGINLAAGLAIGYVLLMLGH